MTEQVLRWCTVLVMDDGSVTVRPDHPEEPRAEYLRAREHAVWEYRTRMPAGSWSTCEMIEIVRKVLTEAAEAAPQD